MSTKKTAFSERDQYALRLGLVLVPAVAEPHDVAGPSIALSIQAKLMQLGYMLDQDAYEALIHAPRDWAIAFHDGALNYLRPLLSTGRDYKPFYRNFPTQVMEMSCIELFLNAVLHYWTNGKWEPSYQLAERGVKFEKTEFKTLTRGTGIELIWHFRKLCGAPTSLTEADKEFITWFVGVQGPEAATAALPKEIPFKETLCHLAALRLDVPVKNPTDVLRIAVHLSGGDISLPGVPKRQKPDKRRRAWMWDRQEGALNAAREAFKFKTFSRAERRFLLGLLEQTAPINLSEMKEREGRWIRLGERLHPGEFKKQFTSAYAAFQVLRNQPKGKPIRTFNGGVDLAFKESFEKGLDLLATRPGLFARKLDLLLRKHDQPTKILTTFARCGHAISAKVLLELYTHFEGRTEKGAPRVIAIKGKRSKMKTLEPLPALDAKLVSRVQETIKFLLHERAAKLPPMGNVWIDERLKTVPLPTAMRSMNAAVKTYVRGTRVPYRADTKVVRAFIHWYDEHGDQDIDLSAQCYDANFVMKGHISYTNLRDGNFQSCHSGDIIARQGACAEYVDIDVEACRKAGVRYVTIQGFNYRGGALHEVKDCVFGLMEREFPESNSIFLPETISNCMPLANEGNRVLVCVIDLETSEYIWADVEADSCGLVNVEQARGATTGLLPSLVRPPKFSVYDLLAIHAKARGAIVLGDTADVVFNWEDFVTDYAATAQYMAF